MRILDMFCGGGCAAIGYKLAVPSAVITGVDTRDMSNRYPFFFKRGNALSLDYLFLEQFNFIHASPPCQAYSKATPRERRANHDRLIAATVLMLEAINKPYIIENVEGSGQDLQPDTCVWLNGKRRYFKCSFPVPIKIKVSSSYNAYLFGKEYVSKRVLCDAWGIPGEYRTNMRREDIRQGVPPVMIIELMKYFKGV